MDPLQHKYPELTPYQYASNNPTTDFDIDGLEGDKYAKRKGFNSNNSSVKLNISEKQEQYYKKKFGDIPVPQSTGTLSRKGSGGIIDATFKLQSDIDEIINSPRTEQMLGGDGIGQVGLGALKACRDINHRAMILGSGMLLGRERAFDMSGHGINSKQWTDAGILTLADIALIGTAFIEAPISTKFSVFTKLKSPARTVGLNEGILLDESNGLMSSSSSKFANIKIGIEEDLSSKYLWTIDERGINICLESTPMNTARGTITHTNISSKAYAGGEAWFTSENKVTINAWSGRYGAGANMTEAEWSESINLWKDIGYEVKVIPYTPKK